MGELQADEPAGRPTPSLVPLLLFAVFLSACANEPPPSASARVPVLYCSDLFHPHDDPDDHFDLACLYALGELDVRGIVLDQGDRQERAPGSVAVRQMNALTGRKVPYAVGLSAPLRAVTDTGRDQPAGHQRGVELILEVLSASAAPVTIITVGSLRDVAAALNRAPGLFQQKVARLLVFIGAVNSPKPEWNVMLDPQAFTAVMNSGLPVYWVPCFDGGNFRNAGRASFWRAPHARLLEQASDPVLRYFVYALLKKEDADPVGFLSKETAANDLEEILTPTRNLWCTAVFPFVAGREVVRRDGGWISVPRSAVREGEETVTPFRFVPVTLSVNDEARVVYGEAEGALVVHRFEVVDRESYAEVMTSVTANLIGSLGPQDR
jgi:Inosine-uridine preferring nucleoside hydrolase